MTENDLILVDNNNKLSIRFINYKYSINNFFSNHTDILDKIIYLTNNYYYYNNKIIICENSQIILKYIIARYINYRVDIIEYYNATVFNNQKCSYYYLLLDIEYNIKLITDKCIYELIKYIKNREKIKLFYKNELPFLLHNLMMLNFSYAKNCEYENCPEGFIDSF